MNEAFVRVFGDAEPVVASAPGRVNLIGDHTDYAEGFCLPMPLNLSTEVAVAASNEFSAFSLSNNEMRSFDPTASAQGNWTDYVAGPIGILREVGIDVPPLNVLIRSTVPQGAGVSSSAALEVAVIRACLAFVGVELPDMKIARLAQQAENSYCGLQCGILDQMACAVGRPGQALLLDCRTDQGRLVAVPRGFHFVVLHCGQERKLVDGAYNQRRVAVKKAADLLGIPALRDATLEMIEAGLDDPELSRRARHVVSENSRVLAAVEALQTGDVAGFGRLMTESHWSLARDYEVSTPALDRLVESALAHGAVGARLTGAGFGGCVVALAHPGELTGMLMGVAAANPSSWVVQM